jgi:hypothetical protein
MPQPPRFSVRSIVLRDSRISATAKTVYSLLDELGAMRGIVRIKRRSLALQSGLSVRTVQRILIALATAGYISRTRSRYTSEYRLAWVPEVPSVSLLEGSRSAIRVTPEVPSVSLLEGSVSLLTDLRFSIKGNPANAEFEKQKPARPSGVRCYSCLAPGKNLCDECAAAIAARKRSAAIRRRSA